MSGLQASTSLPVLQMSQTDISVGDRVEVIKSHILYQTLKVPTGDNIEGLVSDIREEKDSGAPLYLLTGSKWFNKDQSNEYTFKASEIKLKKKGDEKENNKFEDLVSQAKWKGLQRKEKFLDVLNQLKSSAIGRSLMFSAEEVGEFLQIGGKYPAILLKEVFDEGLVDRVNIREGKTNRYFYSVLEKAKKPSASKESKEEKNEVSSKEANIEQKSISQEFRELSERMAILAERLEGKILLDEANPRQLLQALHKALPDTF